MLMLSVCCNFFFCVCVSVLVSRVRSSLSRVCAAWPSSSRTILNEHKADDLPSTRTHPLTVIRAIHCLIILPFSTCFFSSLFFLLTLYSFHSSFMPLIEFVVLCIFILKPNSLSPRSFSHSDDTAVQQQLSLRWQNASNTIETHTVLTVKHKTRKTIIIIIFKQLMKRRISIIDLACNWLHVAISTIVDLNSN